MGCGYEHREHYVGYGGGYGGGGKGYRGKEYNYGGDYDADYDRDYDTGYDDDYKGGGYKGGYAKGGGKGYAKGGGGYGSFKKPGSLFDFGGGGGDKCPCAECKKKKLKAAVLAAVLFAILASPFAFKTVDSIVGRVVKVVGPTGVPTIAGLALHALVYGLVTRRLMH